jgi:hypothetical protein
VLARVVDEDAFNRILMDLVSMIQEILSIANPMTRESASPDFSNAADHEGIA